MITPIHNFLGTIRFVFLRMNFVLEYFKTLDFAAFSSTQFGFVSIELSINRQTYPRDKSS